MSYCAVLLVVGDDDQGLIDTGLSLIEEGAVEVALVGDAGPVSVEVLKAQAAMVAAQPGRFFVAGDIESAAQTLRDSHGTSFIVLLRTVDHTAKEAALVAHKAWKLRRRHVAHYHGLRVTERSQNGAMALFLGYGGPPIAWISSDLVNFYNQPAPQKAEPATSPLGYALIGAGLVLLAIGALYGLLSILIQIPEALGL